MASLVTGAAISHSPLMNVTPLPGDAEAIEQLLLAVSDLGKRILASEPDVVIVLAQDHMRSLFYDLMPAVTIATGRLSGWGDWGTRQGGLPTDKPLARHLHRHLMHHGMEAACSYDLRVDHGVCQPVEMLGLPETLPIIPILINCLAPPLPTPRRCYELGRLLRDGIAAFGPVRRVAVVASGGLSHSPPAGDVESEAEQDQAAVRNMIHGRPDVMKLEHERQQRLVEMVRAGVFKGRINPDWDRWLLDRWCAGEGPALAELTDEDILEDGGAGGGEIRTWLALSGVYEGLRARRVYYQPIDSLITGMGVVEYETDVRTS